MTNHRVAPPVPVIRASDTRLVHAGGELDRTIQEVIMKIRKITQSTPHQPTKTETDFDQVVTELEKLSNRFGIAIKCVGDIQTFDPTRSQVTYSGDFSTGDLEPRIHRREQKTNFHVEVTEMPKQASRLRSIGFMNGRGARFLLCNQQTGFLGVLQTRITAV
jgi:hypothetical protein